MKNRKLHLYILTWMAYITFSMLVFPFLSITVMLFSIPLTMMGGWLYRYKGALATTAAITPYHYLMLNIHSNDPSVISEAFNPLGIASLMVFSLSTALLKSLRQRYNKLNAELEHIVALRTNDLRQLADHLLEIRFIDRSMITSGLLDNPLELLENMQKSSSLLCTHLEEGGHPEEGNAKTVDMHIQQCMEHLTDFINETEDAPVPDATLREQVGKLSEKMMRLGGGGLNITRDGRCDQLDKEVTHQLYRIISEAVANAIRHAKATEIKIRCRQDPLGTTICVENNGLTLPDRYQEGMGLPLMRHRAMSIGGTLTIEGGTSQRTRVICTIPHPATSDKKAFPRDGQRLNTTA